MGEKVYLDDKAVSIVAKHRARLSRGWEADASDVLRDLDARLEQYEAQLREVRRDGKRLLTG